MEIRPQKQCLKRLLLSDISLCSINPNLKSEFLQSSLYLTIKSVRYPLPLVYTPPSIEEALSIAKRIYSKNMVQLISCFISYFTRNSLVATPLNRKHITLKMLYAFLLCCYLTCNVFSGRRISHVLQHFCIWLFLTKHVHECACSCNLILYRATTDVSALKESVQALSVSF